MRSLKSKLTLAFLLIGILGAVLVALILTIRTNIEFNRFVEAQGAEQFSSRLITHYDENSGWGDTDLIPAGSVRWGSFALVDSGGEILIGPKDKIIDSNRFPVETPLELNGSPIGTLFMRDDGPRLGPREGAERPENRFIRSVFTASAASALVAAAAALAVAVVLSRQLTQPIRALTSATQRMAGGALGTQVAVESGDEIGRLATSFNQMSQDLADASHKRKQLTADIAHDLRTPLSILRGYMEGIKDGTLQSTPELNAIMYEEVEHLEHLVKDLRTLSLADAGELSLNKRAVDPKALLERTGLAYVMQAEQQGVALRIDADDALPSVAVDAERMTQVLNNLVSNALRFTDAGEVVLSASADADHIDLQVRDSGSGIKQEALPHVFDRFYRSDASRQRQSNGAVSSGLGLAIAKALVKAHGGEIGVESISAEIDPTNSGTTFSIMLPTAT